MSEKRPPELTGNDVNAYCPVCDARSNFVRESGAFSPGTSRRLSTYYGLPSDGNLTFLLLKCVTCSLGGFAAVYEQRRLRYSQSALASFYPMAYERLPLPKDTPNDIVSEFRSAENCAGIGEYRPAATMLRSSIEKVLKKHGYNQQTLASKLKQLMEDRIITKPLAKQNQEIVRILGNDVLHDDWRDLSSNEYKQAHKYAHRLIDAFYDDHEGVIEELAALGHTLANETSPSTKEDGEVLAD